MILHILDEEKFLKKAIQIFEDILPNDNVYLIGVDDKRSEVYHERINFDCSFYALKGSRRYKDLFKEHASKANIIFFHNLYKDYKLNLFPLIPNRTKNIWYLWGAEIYGLNPKINNLLPLTRETYKKSLPVLKLVRKEILSKIKKRYQWKLFKKTVRQKIDYILTNISEDIDLLDTYVENKAKRGWFTYFSFNEQNLADELVLERQNILIGNSSSATNNHIEAFKMIVKKDISKRKVFVPLSYGDMFYKKVVLSKGKSVLKQKMFPITEFLSFEEYNSILKSCSVLIMNHKRQQAFNTIMMALAAGCKVFLREENTIYSCLKREGFLIFSIQKDFDCEDALNPLTEKEMLKNITLSQQLYNYQRVKNRIKQEVLSILSERD
ncbi:MULTISPECIES: TDP-N-acetylfucosamine:lipid II N-acetylfucosaminyltransferase [unclassified Flagellimonas]|uniref:TDP-N-acetylfucosamine:lipid II N-acetylfucosaminyltransferase n=1 Tax=Flagellimonas sp. MMG031 TaxID=3158549 RepID=A0AAU7MZY3_9FLAO